MHYKLIILGVALIGFVIFGFIFWDDLKFNQQEISNMALPPDPILEINNDRASSTMPDQDPNSAPLNSNNDLDSIDSDLDSTNLEIDSDSSQMESDANAL